MSRSDYKHSEETKRKIGNANKIALLGNIPWNKGMKGRKDWHNTKGLLLGPAWNKGTKGVMVAWNKGKKGIQVAWNKGKTNTFSPESLKVMRLAKLGKPLLIETRLKMSAAHKARREKSHLWKGGITATNTAIRNSSEFRIWRKHVFERDNYTCQACNQRGGVLNADHELPFSLYPDLRLEILNGRTLCKPCHQKIPTNNAVWQIPVYG